MLRSKPCVFHHKLLIWPPCGIVLSGGMHHDLNLIPASQMNPICFIWMLRITLIITDQAPLLILNKLLSIHRSFTALRGLSLWGKHGGHSLGFSCRLLIPLISYQLKLQGKRQPSNPRCTEQLKSPASPKMDHVLCSSWSWWWNLSLKVKTNPYNSVQSFSEINKSLSKSVPPAQICATNPTIL